MADTSDARTQHRETARGDRISYLRRGQLLDRGACGGEMQKSDDPCPIPAITIAASDWHPETPVEAMLWFPFKTRPTDAGSRPRSWIAARLQRLPGPSCRWKGHRDPRKRWQTRSSRDRNRPASFCGSEDPRRASKVATRSGRISQKKSAASAGGLPTPTPVWAIGLGNQCPRSRHLEGGLFGVKLPGNAQPAELAFLKSVIR